MFPFDTLQQGNYHQIILTRPATKKTPLTEICDICDLSCCAFNVYLCTVSIGFFDNSKPVVAQFAHLAKLAQLVQMAPLA